MACAKGKKCWLYPLGCFFPFSPRAVLLELKRDTFFHFIWNSLRAGHVSLHAQEKKTHATPIPAHFKQNMPNKCQEKKNFPWEEKGKTTSLGKAIRDSETALALVGM